ncbi:hypothetical protein [Luteimicrobium album]|uniref:hypothetical protein n=1 Tax=Luteimicrobium album TaxID=1054550 RepID=UPI0024E104E3|nr:hypothetical protein [Luteimicrobium album]
MSSFALQGMAAGETRAVNVDLLSPHGTDGRVVRMRVAGTGTLADSLTSTVTACPVTWRGDVCPGGREVTLARSWRAPASGDGKGLRVPAGDAAHLRVLVTVDDDAPPGASGMLRFEHLVQGADPAEPGSQAIGSQYPGALAATGAVPLTWAVLAGAVAGGGLGLVARTRSMRRRGGVGDVDG